MLHRTHCTERPVLHNGELYLLLTGHRTLTSSVRCTIRCSEETYKLPAHGTGRYPVRSVLRAGLQPPWVRDRTLPGESGASVRCLTLSTALFQRLRTSPAVQRPVPPWAP